MKLYKERTRETTVKLISQKIQYENTVQFAPEIILTHHEQRLENLSYFSSSVNGLRQTINTPTWELMADNCEVAVLATDAMSC